MAKLKRGLRKEFEELSHELRTDLGRRPSDPLCPWELADSLEIPVFRATELNDPEQRFSWLLSPSDTQFFGCVIPIGMTRRGILHNDTVAKTRQASDLAHELSHILLGHPLSAPDCGDGKRAYDPDLEHEARELGMAILVSKQAALSIAMSGASVSQAASQYGVSNSLIEYRLRITNARNWAYHKRNRQRF